MKDRYGKSVLPAAMEALNKNRFLIETGWLLSFLSELYPRNIPSWSLVISKEKLNPSPFLQFTYKDRPDLSWFARAWMSLTVFEYGMFDVTGCSFLECLEKLKLDINGVYDPNKGLVLSEIDNIINSYEIYCIHET